MSSKTVSILKAVFFILLGVGLAISMLTGSSNSNTAWKLVGIIICVIAAVGYLKQAFDK